MNSRFGSGSGKYNMSENFEKRFEDLMRSQKVSPEILGNPNGVWIARYIDQYGEEIVLRELASKKEYDEWYDRIGRDIEKNHGGKVKMEFGPSELKPVNAKIVGVINPEKSPTTQSFEDYMKANKLENLVKKEGHVFKVMYKEKGEKDFELFGEADTADEARDLFKTARETASEEGYEMEIRYELKDK